MDELAAFIFLGVTASWLYVVVEGHGRMFEPPGRASMWRFGYKTPPNYNDNQLFCGGVGVQYSPEVNGRCGVCGDPWNGARENEAGGKYARGIIVRKYATGQIINVTIDLTANHKGYFEFRLCQKDNPFKRSTWACLNENILKLAKPGSPERYMVQTKKYNEKIVIDLQLPKHVTCKACMLQWKYNAGNSWGVDKKTGKGCVGCGNQEQFYACADIAIGHGDVLVGKSASKNGWEQIKKKNSKNSDLDGNSGNISNVKVDFSLFIVCFIMFVYISTLFTF